MDDLKIASITMVRNESKRIKEWIYFHHKFHNINHFVFYLDNPTDDTKELLDELKNQYSIDYYFTNQVGEYDGNNCELAVDRQIESFTKGFSIYKKTHDWVIVFDVDEFIVPVDINNYNLRQTLSETHMNILYLPMYIFVPPFDYDKSITEQNFNRISTEWRKTSVLSDCGKSITRGKIYLEDDLIMDIHKGPLHHGFRDGIDWFTSEYKFRLHHFQSHTLHANAKFDVFDDSIKRMLLTN